MRNLPKAHGYSGFVSAHSAPRKVLFFPRKANEAEKVNEPNRANSELPSGNWDSIPNASPMLPLVWHQYTPIHFWLDCASVYWREYHQRLFVAPVLRVVTSD